MPKTITPADVPGLLKPGMTVYAPGLAGESGLIVDALKAQPEAAAGVRFVGVWLPGYNRFDYTGLHPTARAMAVFLTPDLHDAFANGRLAFHPVTYLEAYRWLERSVDVDLALLQVSPPADDGTVSHGVAWDFTPAIMAKAKVRVAHVNPLLPRTLGREGVQTLRYQDLDYVVEADHPVAGERPSADPTFAAIGTRIAGLVPDHATLEVGIGRVQGVLGAFTAHRGLRFHSGAITTPVGALIDAGAVEDADGAITAGVAWGEHAFYERSGRDPRFRFAPVGWTHTIERLSAIERFVAINAVLEVDLLGQANAEMIDGRQVSSAGGITDFMRGARASPGGFSVVALPATAKGGTRSKIVPAFPAGSATSVTRQEMEVVATEHGMADLRGLDVDSRAEALIGIAAPDFRDELANAWTERRKRL